VLPQEALTFTVLLTDAQLGGVALQGSGPPGGTVMTGGVVLAVQV
jgi:hypothetical protein